MTQHGQALVEVLIITTVIIAILFVSLRDFVTAHEQSLASTNAARQQLWQPIHLHDKQRETNPLVTLSDDYAFANVTRASLGALERLTSLDLPTTNLLSIRAHKNARPLSVLLNDWSVATTTGLVTQPQQLVSSRVLQHHSIQKLQDILGWLPNAREFRSSSLRFGHINADAVPAHSLCELRSC